MSARRSVPGVILDRDGTLIDFVRDAELGVVTPAFHPAQLRLLPGVVAGLGALAQAGFVLAIATNQPGAAKGELTRAAIARTNEALVTLLATHGIRIAAFETCLHHPDGGPGGDPELITACTCRKPLPGMLERIGATLELERARSWMVGDSAVDLGAARAAGLRAGLVAALGRCELCPLRAPALAIAPPSVPVPEVCEARFDLVAARILALDA